MISEHEVIRELERLRSRVNLLVALNVCVVVLSILMWWNLSTRTRWIERKFDQGKAIFVSAETFNEAVKAEKRRSDADSDP